MAKPKALIGSVSFLDDDQQLHTFYAGDVLPEKFAKYVTNADLFGDAPAPTADPAQAGSGEGDQTSTNPYEGVKFNDLKKLAKDRGIDTKGTADAITARLVEADKAAADATQKSVDEMSREELVAHALEQGVVADDITEETSEAEIVALIENAKG